MNTGLTRISHEQAALLMPAFVQGNLDTQRQRQIQEHIAGCPACALRHREDLELADAIGNTPAAIELLLTSASRERNRQRLLESISSPTGTVVPTPAEKRHLPTARMTALAAGLAAVSLVTILLTRDPASPGGYAPVTYRTQTNSPRGAPTIEGPIYRVVFQPGTTLNSIERLLLEFDAVIVGGPSGKGVYTLAFPTSRSTDEEILGRLRQRPEIVLAERSVHGDG